MGRALHDAWPVARDLFAAANDILDFDLRSLCFDGPENLLRQTENAQPALFLVNAIAYSVLHDGGVEPFAVAGHSVGEYSALFSTGVLSFEDGLRAVRRRGELMAQAGLSAPGTMAAVIGLAAATVEELCEEAAGSGVVDVANENSRYETVISGEAAAVERVMELAEERDGVVAIPLAVSGAFHSRLMQSVACEMAAMLESVTLCAPRIPVIANVTGDVVTTPAEIRDTLVRQVAGRVRWRASVERLATLGADRLIEVGPGKTLTRLAHTLVPQVTLMTTEAALLDGAAMNAGRATSAR
jgi:[acyl-carrier-protein] S-malonyltransferase